MDPKDLITPEEAARLAGVATETLRHYSRHGRAPALAVDGPRYSRSAIVEWLAHGRPGRGRRTDLVGRKKS